MGGLNINLWSALSHTQTHTRTEWSYKLVERAGCHVVRDHSYMEDFKFLDEEGREVVFTEVINGFSYSINYAYQQSLKKHIL